MESEGPEPDRKEFIVLVYTILAALLASTGLAVGITKQCLLLAPLSARSKPRAEEDAACRICHEQGELEVFCDCKGSLALVHEQCLQRWRERSGDRCELCRGYYSVQEDWCTALVRCLRRGWDQGH
ncbi:unnamed protein product [Effrenium voratum]|nr:unnamed protein product [Effrenium voratum]